MYSNVTTKVNALKEELHREETDREDNVIRVADSMQNELERFNEAIDL